MQLFCYLSTYKKLPCISVCQQNPEFPEFVFVCPFLYYQSNYIKLHVCMYGCPLLFELSKESEK